jgi:hypothetical protein
MLNFRIFFLIIQMIIMFNGMQYLQISCSLSFIYYIITVPYYNSIKLHYKLSLVLPLMKQLRVPLLDQSE